jgi:CTP:molybdopterin cytidylyltransferase MocA
MRKYSAAIILSGGASARMGSPKALIDVGGRTLLEDQVQRLRTAGIERIGVVIGAHAKEIRAAHPALDVDWIENRNWANGHFSSVRCGLQGMMPAGCNVSGILILPVDVPGVPPDVMKKIVDEGTRSGRNIVPTFQFQRGHPVFISTETAREIGSGSAKFDRLDLILESSPDTLKIEVGSDAVLRNVNSEKDFRET